MKRLSLLVAIFLIATIGGAYAAFIYPGAQGNATSTHNRAIYLETATQSGSVGDFAITSNVDRIWMDQTAHDENLVLSDYSVALNVAYTVQSDSAPSIRLTFTPKAGASQEIKDNAKTTYVYIGFVTNHLYDDPSTVANEQRQIFDVHYDKENFITVNTVNSGVTPDGDRALIWSPDGSGAFYVDLVGIDSIEKLVSLTGDFELDTIEKYEAFKQGLGDTFVNLVVTATTVPLS